MNKLNRAFDELLSIIARGMEYPDAESLISMKYNLDGKDLYELQLRYDNL